MDETLEEPDSKFPLWLWLLAGLAVAVAFLSAHFYYGNIWFGFVIVIVEALIGAVHVGVLLAWKYFFD